LVSITFGRILAVLCVNGWRALTASASLSLMEKPVFVSHGCVCDVWIFCKEGAVMFGTLKWEIGRKRSHRLSSSGNVDGGSSIF